MSTRLYVLFAAFFIVGCSTTTTADTPREDAVMSGEKTAKKAATAAREARDNDNTGVLIESSEPTDESEPDEPAEQPPRSVLRIELQRGTPTMNGEPIPENMLGDVVREAVEANPDVLVVFVRDSMTGPDVTERFMDAAREAGAKRVEERPSL